MFPALKSRFHTNPVLRRVGRELFQGFDNQRLNVPPPYTEVNGRVGSRPSTFESDVAVYSLTFRYHAKDIRMNSAADWAEAMQETFVGNIESPFFHCAGCEPGEVVFATSTNSTYDASFPFTLTIQRLIGLPLARYV